MQFGSIKDEEKRQLIKGLQKYASENSIVETFELVANALKELDPDYIEEEE